MMDSTFFNVTKVKFYVYDFVVHSETEESHMKHLENLFALLLKHGIRI